MSNEERDSQLSAMFDGELAVGECELLARRLARDPALQDRWGRYAAIGACIRGQNGVRLSGQGSVADRVRGVLDGEPAQDAAAMVGVAPALRSYLQPARWLKPLAGFATAAGVAAISILWLRSQGADNVVVAVQTPAPAEVSAPAPAVASTRVLLGQEGSIQPVANQGLFSVVADVPASSSSAPRSGLRERDSYVVPAPNTPGLVVLPAQDTNYQGRPAQYPGPAR